MSVESIEASYESSHPRELITITHGSTTYRITTATRDILHDGNIYTATAGARGEIGVAQSGNTKEATITLPINHAFVRRWLAGGGNPPDRTTVTIVRKFYPSGDTRKIFEGEIDSLSVSDEGTEATFRCESRLGRAMLRVIPQVSAGRICPHMLYDSMCGIDREGMNPDGHDYKVTATVLHVDGRDVRFDLSNVPAGYSLRSDWCENGELVVASGSATGERAAIAEQNDLSPGFSTVTVVSLNAAIYGLKVGDSIDVYAGCLFDIVTCSAKFANKLRHGGFPQLPNKNPFMWVSYGAGDEI